VRSKAGKSQLNLPHGTKTKPDMQKTARAEKPRVALLVRDLLLQSVVNIVRNCN